MYFLSNKANSEKLESITDEYEGKHQGLNTWNVIHIKNILIRKMSADCINFRHEIMKVTVSINHSNE